MATDRKLKKEVEPKEVLEDGDDEFEFGPLEEDEDGEELDEDDGGEEDIFDGAEDEAEDAEDDDVETDSADDDEEVDDVEESDDGDVEAEEIEKIEEAEEITPEEDDSEKPAPNEGDGEDAETAERDGDPDGDADEKSEEKNIAAAEGDGNEDGGDGGEDVDKAEADGHEVATVSDDLEDDGEWPIHERAEAMLKDVAYAASTPRPRDGFDVGSIEVSLTFDLGTVRLSLRDLESIKEGYTFTLERPNDEFVTIRANGHPIGRGRLVNVDGRVGVQIEDLNG